MNSDDLMLFAIVTLVAAAVLLRPVFRAWARRLDNSDADPGLSREVLELRDRVAELEASRDRMLELEERLDFAERMLIQRGESAPAPLHRTPV